MIPSIPTAPCDASDLRSCGHQSVRSAIVGAPSYGRSCLSLASSPRKDRSTSRMEGWQALVLAVVQGVTELFPISSLAHAVLLPPLLGWHWAQRDETFLPFLVVLHLG